MSVLARPDRIVEACRRQREEVCAYAREHLVKAAGDPVKTFALSGELYLSDSGWLLLRVPNALVRGCFDALDEPGVELPRNSAGRLNAHISVMDADEVKACGGPDAITERGHHYRYSLGAIKSVDPGNWKGVSRVWYVAVDSPELRQLRKSYGLEPLRKGYDHHVTIGIRRTKILHENETSKAAAVKQALTPTQTTLLNSLDDILLLSLARRRRARQVSPWLPPPLPPAPKAESSEKDAAATHHAAAVKVEVRGRAGAEVWLCPHCGAEITEKSIYRDKKGWHFHRPCFMKGKGSIKLPEKKAADLVGGPDPYPQPQTGLTATLGGVTSVGGTLAAGGALAARPAARLLHRAVQTNLPLDPGLAGRLDRYRQGIAGAGKDPGRLMAEYVRGGHDVLSNPATRTRSGLDMARQMHEHPVAGALSGGQSPWPAKKDHFTQFAASPLQAQAQIVRELYGDRADEMLLKAKFQPQYDAIKSQIERAARLRGVDPAAWHQDATLKARFQPQYDVIDAARQRAVAGGRRLAGVPGASSQVFYNDAWRTVKAYDPALFREISAAGVRSPADLAKLPPELQNRVVQTFARHSELGRHVARNFRAVWRNATPFFETWAGRAGRVAKGVNVLNRVLPQVVRHAPAVAAGGGVLAALGIGARVAGNRNDAARHADETQAWRRRLVEQVRREVTPPAPPRPPSLLQRLGVTA